MPTCLGLRPSGFTLLEVLVGLSLLAILGLVLYGAFWLGIRSWQAAAERHETTENIRLVVDFLQNYLNSAYPLVRQEDNEQRLQFYGDTHRLSFVTDMPPHLGIAGLYSIVLEFVANDGQHDLIATRTLLHPDLEPSAEETGRPTQRAVLARGLAEAHFAYFGPPPSGAAPAGDMPSEWQDQWTNDRQLPTLVSLDIIPSAGPSWPTLVLRPRIDGMRRETARGAAHESAETTFPAQGDDSFAAPALMTWQRNVP